MQQSHENVLTSGICSTLKKLLINYYILCIINIIIIKYKLIITHTFLPMCQYVCLVLYLHYLVSFTKYFVRSWNTYTARKFYYIFELLWSILVMVFYFCYEFSFHWLSLKWFVFFLISILISANIFSERIKPSIFMFSFQRKCLYNFNKKKKFAFSTIAFFLLFLQIKSFVLDVLPFFAKLLWIF